MAILEDTVNSDLKGTPDPASFPPTKEAKQPLTWFSDRTVSNYTRK